jgi:ADP-ribose pyrophosphatase YjhB (NUDIX family)
VAVDVVLLSVRDGAIRALLGRRDDHPHRGRWALPGSFLRIDESLDAAAARVLATKAGMEGIFSEQLYTFGAPERDPRTRVLSVAYYALVEPTTLERAVATRADAGLRLARLAVPWPGETGGPVDAIAEDGTPLPLAFDHADVLGMAVKRIRGKLDYAPIGFELLPDAFSCATCASSTRRSSAARSKATASWRGSSTAARRRDGASGQPASPPASRAVPVREPAGHLTSERRRRHGAHQPLPVRQPPPLGVDHVIRYRDGARSVRRGPRLLVPPARHGDRRDPVDDQELRSVP